MTVIKLSDYPEAAFGRAVAELRAAGAAFDAVAKTWELETVDAPEWTTAPDVPVWARAEYADSIWYVDGTGRVDRLYQVRQRSVVEQQG
jgi:hypothetical protein